MKNSSLGQDLTVGSIPRTLLLFSCPLMLSNMLQIVYNLVDMAVVGRFVGSVGLSAVVNGGDIVTLVTMLCMGFASAGQVIIAQYVGQGDHDKVSRTIGTLLIFMTALSFAAMAAGLLLSDWALSVLNVPQEAHAWAKDYTVVCFWGMFFIFGYNEVSAILRGMGDSKHPLIFVTISAGTNLLLDLLFVAVLDLGVWGAAVATVMGQGLSFVCSLIFLYRRRSVFYFGFRRRDFVVDRDLLLALIKLGVPMAINYCAVSLSKLCVNSFINSYGVAASAVTGVGQRIGQCAMIVTNALNTAGASMIGQNFGAGKLERVARVIYVSLGICLAFSAILSALIVLFPMQIFGLFDSDPEVLLLAQSFVGVAVLRFFGFAMRSPMTALINGLGVSSLSLAVAVFDGIVGRIGLAIFLGVGCGMGIMGFWLGDALAGYIPFFIGGVYFWTGLWRKRKPLSSRIER